MLIPFARAVGAAWAPVLYCLAVTVLQGAFCLGEYFFVICIATAPLSVAQGMIYRMDPFSMPRSFCIAQTIIISTGAFIVAGTSMAFSLATYMTVLKPKTWGDGERCAFPDSPLSEYAR